MKSPKSFLTAAAAAFLLGAAVLPGMAQDGGRQGAERNSAVSEAGLPAAILPVLNIGGKESPDVYLQSLDISVDVTGSVASTRYTMVFKNRTDRILEGMLTFPLPDGRTVTHYALDIGGKMRDAVPADKAKAARVFEEIQRRQIDPGILERVEGNNFRTRVYPIPANGTRTISVGYEEELSQENNLLYYRLPMAYPAPIENFSVKATVWKSGSAPVIPVDESEIRFDKAGENYAAALTRENYRPSRALVFALPAPEDIPQVMMQSAQGNRYFLASVAAKTGSRKKIWGDTLAIVWDVSLSGLQRNLQSELEMLNVIFGDKKNAGVHLYFLNNRLEKVINKNSADGGYKVTNGNWSGLKRVLEKAVFDGGTDFSQIKPDSITGSEILFFSDGISTLSDADFLKNTNVTRPIHCIVSSAAADYSMMKLLAGKSKGKYINLNELSSAKLKNELLNETLQFLGMEHGNTVREVYPSIATPVRGNFSVAGISSANKEDLTLLFGFGNKVERRIKVTLDAKKATNLGNVYRVWAQKKIAELDLRYNQNQAELTALGHQFGIVTRNTSLIVLETVEDYDSYDIEPPASDTALHAEYTRRLKKRTDSRHAKDRNLLKEAVAAADTVKKWWNTYFDPEPSQGTNRSELHVSSPDFLMCGSLDGSGGVNVVPQMYGSLHTDSSANAKGTRPSIKIKQVKNDNEYMKKLTGKTAEDYQTYLKLRGEYISLPAFYFDMADWFYTNNDKEAALRVLTSIAELELENAPLYRLLGYRFREYGEHTLQKFVCQKVIEWRPMEPQSYRDYALALAGNGEAQAALDSLYGTLTRRYSKSIADRNRGTAEIIVTEINRMTAQNPKLNTSKIDKRLLIPIAVDIRVVINWNMDNTDIDLYVKDPRSEQCYFDRKLTKIGGRISADNTGGYGPEQFLLKRAIEGKYQVYVNYYRDNQFTDNGPSTIFAEIFTKYAGKDEQRKVISLQLSKAKRNEESNKVEIAEFEF
ncbi:MAG: DUF2135 domain-containing protein [Chitinispirillia bacterium]|nr:DUF2135 domain-containing protein [Chitinispirillia bacterium]MCL2242606.1 DUF2135 domain-containing protein [Chitinispirillia bacterium]